MLPHQKLLRGSRSLLMTRENIRRGLGCAIKFLPADLIKNCIVEITSLVDDPRGHTKGSKLRSKNLSLTFKEYLRGGGDLSDETPPEST
ncbi:hypothetical protein PanWU01x14_288220 [Parasponia andersonii]|uniref:Uncharacterized protein n=1 Tax=Parasponia andersonii TaxID=3476 RepID=A0A2P5AYP7_PARAD|nr:hypothetical protein PanWU01x14_288220 [Parasponia andersonii]